MKTTITFAMAAFLAFLACQALPGQGIGFSVGTVDLATAELGIDAFGPWFLGGQRTDLVVLGGGGYLLKRQVWVDAAGNPLASVDPADTAAADVRTFRRLDADWSIRLQQGLVQSAGQEAPVMAVYARYKGHADKPVEDGAASTLMAGSAFPDHAGTVFNMVSAGLVFNTLNMAAAARGISAELAANWAPAWLANSLAGAADFLWFKLDARAFLPVFQVKSGKGLNLLSLVVGDRILANAVFGQAVPNKVTNEVAFGTNLRGLEDGEKATAGMVVNNFDLRLNGPEIFIAGIYPNIHGFLDAGWHGGNYFNSAVPGSQFVCSTGFEAGMSFFEAFNIGYRWSWLLAGSNLMGSPSEHYATSCLFVTSKF